MTTLTKPFKYYVAGPMTGKPQFNVPAFLEAKEALEALGYDVQLPADLDDPEAVVQLLKSPDGAPNSVDNLGTWGDFLSLDVKLVADVVDGIAVIEGWQKSRGARLETYVARLCGKPIVNAFTNELIDDHELADVFAEVAYL
jgi:hypothetical protein